MRNYASHCSNYATQCARVAHLLQKRRVLALAHCMPEVPARCRGARGVNPLTPFRGNGGVEYSTACRAGGAEPSRPCRADMASNPVSDSRAETLLRLGIF